MQERTKAMRVRRDGGALLDRTERRTEGEGVGLLRTSGDQAGHRPAWRPLLQRILDTPRIAAVVPRLSPDTLHRVIDRCGLEACGALMALATPAQIAHVLDLDLWRRPEAGLDEQFDADRFGVWIEVLVDQGADVAARMIAQLDVDLVAAGLAQHVRIFDIATLEGYVTSDGTDIPAVIERDGGLGCDIAGRRLIPRRHDAWDAILEVLAELHASDPVAFVRLMHACTALSHSRPEAGGLDALLGRGAQSLFDLADARAQRREAHGFASPAEARAFLESSRRLGLDRGSRPAAAAVDLRLDGGLDAPPPRALVAAAPEHTTRLGLIHAQMRAAFERDPAVCSTRQTELASLANALLAGCTVDTRAFTAPEAADAVMATCNLGLECWPPAWRGGAPLPDDFLIGQDLVTVFQVGWTVLHDDVGAYAVSALMGVLAALPPHDSETQAGLDALRRELTRHGRAGTAWQARDALDVLATLDLPAWATLLALIAECPVALSTILTAGRPRARTVDPSAFVFISERTQIAAIHAYLRTLPDALRG